MSVEPDILNFTSYCVSPKCSSLQPTALEVRTGRLLPSSNSAQQGRVPAWPSTISQNLGNEHKSSDRCNFEGKSRLLHKLISRKQQPKKN